MIYSASDRTDLRKTVEDNKKEFNKLLEEEAAKRGYIETKLDVAIERVGKLEAQVGTSKDISEIKEMLRKLKNVR